MKRFTGVTWAVTTVAAALITASGMARAEDDTGQGKGARGEHCGEFRQEIKSHFQQQRQENQEFRKTLKTA
ncbi:MAG: hypothetical protein QME60_06490 [Verrucomicrobiota bacterium]|nr:hypothetical protein [Verrucomicrobiota bacterium]